MKRYFPIIASLLIVGIVGVITYTQKNKIETTQSSIGAFDFKQTCAIQPRFLSKMRVPQPIAVDLSQDRFRGIAFLYGRSLSQAVHPKSWERFDHFSSYILDPDGDMYLTPMPYISVKPTTFNLQKHIYKLDSHTGKLDIWMSLDEVKARSSNPFGLISIDYDCDDHTLWVSAIDESDYYNSRGVIYHIDIKTKKVLQRLEGIDALSLKLLHAGKGKYLLIGSSKDHSLYAYPITKGTIANNKIKLLELPDANEHIRKIILRGKNHLELQAIPFTYTLIAQTAEQGVRTNYDAKWDHSQEKWQLSLKKR